jgi:predicted DNA-binding transcriptional regulator AlpA
MTDAEFIGLSEAASALGISIGTLRRAIRAGTFPAPPHLAATAPIPAAWLKSAQAAVEASPNKSFSRATKQKVAPFARYEGTSAWRKYRNRVREYTRHQAETKAKA